MAKKTGLGKGLDALFSMVVCESQYTISCAFLLPLIVAFAATLTV